MTNNFITKKKKLVMKTNILQIYFETLTFYFVNFSKKFFKHEKTENKN